MAYNFATQAYCACIRAPADVDTTVLRAATVKHIREFDPKLWSDEPVVSMMGRAVVTDDSDTHVDTTDAFGTVNGRMRLASPGVVDKIIEHVQGFKAEVRDFREAVRKVEDEFFGPCNDRAAVLVANQALDFHKQDGITEIEESNQALLVERELNDALLADEARGVLTVNRAPAFVGAVSNFSHFLDLCRKILRNVEAGVPIVVLSRSNTTQHVFRYFQVLAEQLEAHGADASMVTYLACSVDEQRRVLAACPQSPMYFTGSRVIAERIREVAPRLMASTGGPNTMVAESLNAEVAAAARMSNLIENKGQCTAMRHLVVPNADPSIVEAVYARGADCLVASAAESLETKEFAGIFRDQPLKGELAPGYVRIPGELGNYVAFRHSSTLPTDINEQWREIYLDVTAPKQLDDAFLRDLALWCNREQPISLAVNCTDIGGVGKTLFENTSLIVYTMGRPEGKVALTAQARPQDGEIFGEVPPRRQLGRVSRFPVHVPTSTPGYNSSYTTEFLRAQGEEAFEGWGLPDELLQLQPVLQLVQEPARRGYCRQLLAYLADAARGPQIGVGQRTALFGLQRPPLEGGMTCVRVEQEGDVFDDIAPFLLVFLATNARSQVMISLDPSLSLPAAALLAGLTVVQQTTEEFEASEAIYWNVVRVQEASVALSDHPLACHFVSLFLPFGHVKSAAPEDSEFIDAFSRSEKWLRCIGV